ncbi:Tachykinin-like peptide receptor 86C [Folsomia candida]|uniref:Tachykinin-like peptide receptor 86C n=1 Tax=Folsomia candida TaxID=158441 RepID=A0A226E8P0_FOLCA|nr:Tachykinin-like peptide receptor 86C [Folsomia candida]
MSSLMNLMNSVEDHNPPLSTWRHNDSSFWESPLANIQLSDGHDLLPLHYLVTEATQIARSKSPTYNWLELFWISIFGAMLTVSIAGNLTVIWIISCHRRMRTVTNYFLLNLSVADLAMASFNGAPNFVDWFFGKMLCVVNNFTANWTVASCVFTMTAISVDRWIAIVKPLEPRMTKTTSWLAILGIWIGSCILASPALLYTQLVTDNRSMATHCLIVWPDGLDPTNSKYEFGYNICLLVLTYLIPMTAMAICYGSMSWELWFTQVGEITQRQINSMIAKRKVVRMFILVVVTFAICWLPYHGYFIYMHIDKTVIYKKWIQHLYLSFFFLAMSQSAINPIIVIGMNSRFRGYVTEFFFHCTRRRCCNQNPTPHTVHYVAATPPLLRRYSQSCSHSRSKSRSGGTVDDNTTNGPNYHNGRSNGIRKKNMYVTTNREVINLNHAYELTANHSAARGPVSSRTTYC